MRNCILFLVTLAPLTAGIQEPLRVEGGMISGVASEAPGIRAFKGIPYAEPPVGELRWRASRPSNGWDGVRAAAEFGADCQQGSARGRAMSEDCLFLNVWTPAESAEDNLPVLVWVHGGGWRGGSGALAPGNAEGLAAKGLVVVTFNYRVGALGFLSHASLSEESGRNASGNYGLMDQVAALQWVQRNISAFGGDAGRVTIAGSSAGGYAVSFLMATPLAKGLFHAAIGECGGAFDGSLTLATAEGEGEQFARRLSSASLAEMRAKPAAEVIEASGVFRPVVDGYVLPSDVYTIFAEGRQNDVPVLTGSNSDESTILAPPPGAAVFQREVKRIFAEMADGFFKLYPAGSDEEAVTSFFAARRDQTFAAHWTWARMVTKAGNHRAYLYYFAHPPAYPPGSPQANRGATHGAETRYVWNNLLPKEWPWTDSDRKLAETMSSYWANFAAKGDPNGPGLPAWRAYSDSEAQVMRFGDTPEMAPLPHRRFLEFLAASYAAHRNFLSTSNSWDWTN